MGESSKIESGLPSSVERLPPSPRHPPSLSYMSSEDSRAPSRVSVVLISSLIAELVTGRDSCASK